MVSQQTFQYFYFVPRVFLIQKLFIGKQKRVLNVSIINDPERILIDFPLTFF